MLGCRACGLGTSAVPSSLLLFISECLVQYSFFLEEPQSQAFGKRVSMPMHCPGATVLLGECLSPSHQCCSPCQASSAATLSLHPDGAARSHLRSCPLLRVELSPGPLISPPFTPSSSLFQAYFFSPSLWSSFLSVVIIKVGWGEATALKCQNISADTWKVNLLRMLRQCKGCLFP